MHKPVLLKESIDALDLERGETFLDGTLGAGGHAAEVLRRFRTQVRVVGIDRDPMAAAEAGRKFGIETRAANFRHLEEALRHFRLSGVDAILFDLGFSSDQLEGGRGLSFQRDEPLDMRLSGMGFTAAEILNSWDEHAIELVLRGFGEERLSRKIAKEVALRRKARPFRTTFDLVNAVLAVKPKSFRDKIHPATKTFQALRIAVNEELTALEEGLVQAFKALNPGGRLAVISFHSLEDRIVKNFFRERAAEGEGNLITRKPMRPAEDEVRQNPRSRSAKLRVIEKI